MTIEFKKGHNNSRHLEETKLDRDEAIWFSYFLIKEIQRHKDAILSCDYFRCLACACGIKVLEISYESSILGHREDISATQKTVDYLKEKWGI